METVEEIEDAIRTMELNGTAKSRPGTVSILREKLADARLARRAALADVVDDDSGGSERADAQEAVLNQRLEPGHQPAWIDAAAKECADRVLVGEGQRAFAEIISRHGLGQRECNIPPPGWRCTRAAGHDGPCAAIEAGKRGHILVFEGGSLEINLSGYGSGNGKAELVVQDSDLVDCDESRSGELLRKLVIDASEIREIRDFLNRVINE